MSDIASQAAPDWPHPASRPRGLLRDGNLLRLNAGTIRIWLALLFLVLTYFGFEPLERAINHPLSETLALPLLVDGAMSLPHYALLMVVRLLLDIGVVAGVFAILGDAWRGFPLRGPRSVQLALAGVLVGFVVMTGAILAIVVTGSASITVSMQSGTSAAAHGAGWLAADFVGAMGEELFGRVAVLLVAERFFGWRGAIAVSGLMFSLAHLGNPGASWIWLARLFLQGALLAFAVYRTSSVWWSCGYHTGWNWASAPLFGAAGSGYLDQGHILDFYPKGAEWITGGAVGPEGSVFAFVAMAAAFAILRVIVPQGRNPVTEEQMSPA